MGIVLPKAYIMPEDATLVLRVPRYHHFYLLRWDDWIVNALPTYEHTVVSDITILSLVKLS
jgi:hypothetical protein